MAGGARDLEKDFDNKMPKTTEQTHSTTPPSAGRPARGFSLERFNTRPGVDPTTEIEWDSRIAVITGEDGRVVFEGGEYNGQLAANEETTIGYIFDPTASSGKGSWTQLTPPDNGTGDWTQIGDSPCIVLANGTFVIGDHSNTQMAALDPVTLTYTDLNPTGKADAF